MVKKFFLQNGPFTGGVKDTVLKKDLFWVGSGIIFQKSSNFKGGSNSFDFEEKKKIFVALGGIKREVQYFSGVISICPVN